MPSIEAVKAVVGGLPFMTVGQAEVMTELIHKNDVRDVLELGFCHGVSTCYIAAAVAERGDGHVVTIDRATRIMNSPPLEELLDRMSLRDRATIFYEYDSYNWRLSHFLAQRPRPEFDLIYLDGAHTWSIDSAAFLLAEQLLAPGGIIVLDDMHWSFAASDSTRAHTATMPPDERESEQVKLVFDVLVEPHPNIETCWEDGIWGFARKTGTRAPDLEARRAALALIDVQAKEVYARAVAAVHSGVWTYGPWPQSLLPIVDTSDRRKLEDLREFVEKLKRDRAALQSQRDDLTKFVEKLKGDRAALNDQLDRLRRPNGHGAELP